MLCTRKPEKNFATMNPYDYYIETSNAKYEEMKNKKFNVFGDSIIANNDFDYPNLILNNQTKGIFILSFLSFCF